MHSWEGGKVGEREGGREARRKEGRKEGRGKFCFVLFGLQLLVCLWWLQVPLRDLSDA